MLHIRIKKTSNSCFFADEVLLFKSNTVANRQKYVKRYNFKPQLIRFFHDTLNVHSQ